MASHLHVEPREIIKFPLLCITEGIKNFGRLIHLVSVKKLILSELTLVFTGHVSSDCQSSTNSFKEVGSRTAPERM